MSDEPEKENAEKVQEALLPLEKEEKAPAAEQKEPEPRQEDPEAAARPAGTEAQPAEAAVSLEELKEKHLQELKEVKEKMLRIAADFDNYKKRMQREFKDREERAKGDALRAILPTIDNLQRAASHLKDSTEVTMVLEGISIVEKNFIDTMSKLGVQRFESVGKAFDPALHEAVAQQESDEFPAGTVAAEVQAGYMLGDKLLRAALVVVSSGGHQPRETGETGGGENKNASTADAPEDGGSGGPAAA
jgi:molecular chaperone GrpE